MLKINDIFWSAQGEGLNSGISSIFVRLAGCSLRCPYCDTRDAWSAGRRMSVAQVAAVVDGLRAATPGARLVITGGEPLEQDLKELLSHCHEKKYFVAVETNGLHFQDLPFNWWTVSPKDAADYRVHSRLLAKANEFKLLVTPALDLTIVKRLRRCSPASIILQPEYRRPGKYRHAFELFKAAQHAGIADLRLGAQLHKIYRFK